MNYREKINYIRSLETEEEQLEYINNELAKAGNEEFTLMNWVQFGEALEDYVENARFSKSFWELYEIVKNIEEDKDGAYYLLVGFEDDGEPYIRDTYTKDLEYVAQVLDGDYIHLDDNYWLISDYLEKNNYSACNSLLNEDILVIYDFKYDMTAYITAEKAEEISDTCPDDYVNIKLDWGK